ncbi:hypothetical protein ES707_16976 [subsurface metagenome]
MALESYGARKRPSSVPLAALLMVKREGRSNVPGGRESPAAQISTEKMSALRAARLVESDGLPGDHWLGMRT